MKEQIREALYRAAISCGHEITHEQIILYVDSRKEGNALSQLADRLEQAALSAVPAQEPKHDLNSFMQKHVYKNGNDSWNYNSLASSAQDFIDSAVQAFESQQPAQEPDKSLQSKSKDYLISKIVMFQNASKADDRVIKASEILIESLKARIFTLESHAQEPVKQESWISVDERLPDVKQEDYEFVLVSVDSLHTGKTHVFEAAYLSQLQIMTEDGDYTSFTGWHTRTEHPDYDGWYEPIGGNGDERVVTHWMVKPLPPVKEVAE